MIAPIWVTQAIDDFGRMLGFDGLAFDEQGAIQLAIDGRVLLGLEQAEDGVIVYLTCPLIHADRSTYRHALEMCHHGESDLGWMQAALLGEGQLAFATRIANSDFQLPRLEDAISKLTELHDSLAAECV